MSAMVLPTPMPTTAPVLRVVCGTEKTTDMFVASNSGFPFQIFLVAISPKQQDKTQNGKPGFN